MEAVAEAVPTNRIVESQHTPHTPYRLSGTFATKQAADEAIAAYGARWVGYWVDIGARKREDGLWQVLGSRHYSCD